MGPLPRTEAGNQYILVIVDHFTKWTECFALPDIKSETVAECLVTNFIRVHALPERIHSDQGKQFESNLFQELCRRLDIDKSRTTPYHPQGDGTVERANRTLQNMLKIFVNEGQTDWDRLLPTSTLAYNSSVHTATGHTPYYLVFGREARMPLDILYPPPANAETRTVDEFTNELIRCLSEAYSTVRDNLDRHHRSAKERYDRKTRAPPLQVGDKVWLHRNAPPNVSPKLFQFWSGPWQIVGAPTDLTYRIEPRFESPVRHRPTTVHRNRLKKCLTPASAPVRPNLVPNHQYNTRSRANP